MTTNYRIADESCALLISVSAYEDPEFPPIQAARNSLTAMQQVLADPELCGWDPDSIAVVNNPSSVTDLAVQITNLARATHNVLLIYYVGHGALSHRGELSLTVTTTMSEHPRITGLPWSVVADALRDSPARMRCVILDCCFAGQAIEAMAETSGNAVADISHVEGVYTLTATTRNRTAHVPPPNQQDSESTSFTTHLVDLLRSGIPGGPADLTFAVIYSHLRARLAALGLPLPNQRNTDLADKFVFARNVATYSESCHETKQEPEPEAASKPASSEEVITLDSFAAQVFSDIASDDSEDITNRLEAAERLTRLDFASAIEAYSGIANDDSIDFSDRLEAAEHLTELDYASAVEAFRDMTSDSSLDFDDRRAAATRLGELDEAAGTEASSAIESDERNTVTIGLDSAGCKRAAIGVNVVIILILAVTLIIIAAHT